jgi:hypothetical protein
MRTKRADSKVVVKECNERPGKSIKEVGSERSGLNRVKEWKKQKSEE